MCSGMPRGGRRPTYSVNPVNLVLLDLLDLLSSSRLLEVKRVTFSRDSSREWKSPWSVTQNLSRSWRKAIWCSRTLGSKPVSGNVSILSHDICKLIRDHDPAHTIHYLWLSHPCRFQARYSFPSYLWFLNQKWVGIGGFTLTKLRHVGDEEKTIPSCLDTRSPMIAPPVLPQSAFCALKKNRLAEVRSFQVFDFRHFKCSESECWITAGKPVRTDGVVWNLTQHFR